MVSFWHAASAHIDMLDKESRLRAEAYVLIAGCNSQESIKVSQDVVCRGAWTMFLVCCGLRR